MKNYEIEDIKTYMNELLVNDKYDSFYLYEIRLKTSLDYYISGKINKEFFDTDDEMADVEDYVNWGEVKQTIFDLIKGKRLPISFKIILMFNRDNIERLVEMNNIPINPEDVSNLSMNIYYEGGKLLVPTGTSLKVFTLDKTLEHIWDDTVGKYYI
ncbi:MAG: hypothetical protein J6A25_12585 [Lachnospiraceae bacterium]|nr:hypothetical protein [Lachnospiraceae bacterium]